ncbi:HupE/UreJ family protein [Octadecabacter sp. 1_MG-2023]|uniref:HupE/UreJ family protein n=1 Tax=unclassified Octadecabacter TaxID=196158 RepID=UPI00209128ED|nr:MULTISPECIES: HupE/UreJ family protein [unclassified Octadecabacter]MDO6733275.1 HupE/UreJ family protein [Octadecabacter sp. 1_MG-2023]
MRMKFSDKVMGTVARLLSVSMATVIWFTLTLAAQAHEVLPSIGDMEVVDGQLTFKVDGNLESLVAGINLDGLEDTEAAPEADRYTELRAQEPNDFIAEIDAYWPQMSESIKVLVDGAPVELTLTGIAVPEVGNVDIVRTSTLEFTATLAEGAEAMQIAWPAEYGVLVLRQMGVEAGWDGYLSGGGMTDPVQLGGGDAMTGGEAFVRFIPVGVEHIVPLGLDHILFVLGLFFLSTRMRPLLWQVTAFTAAHTVTLALATMGFVNIPDEYMWIVESIIAASIVYVAVENIFTDGLNPWRPAIIFCFGLLHGLGFASVLTAYGLPDGAVLPALIGFNIGVELGQLLCIAVAFIIVVSAVRLSEDGKVNKGAAWAYMGIAILVVPLAIIPISAMGPDAVEAYLPLLFMVAALSGLCAASCAVERFETYRHMVAMPASIGIALIGAYWVVERVFL